MTTNDSGYAQTGQAGAVPDAIIQKMQIALGRGLDCFVASTECEEVVELLFSELRRDGWRILPPAFEALPTSAWREPQSWSGGHICRSVGGRLEVGQLSETEAESLFFGHLPSGMPAGG